MDMNGKHFFWLNVGIFALSLAWAFGALGSGAWDSFVWNAAVCGVCAWNFNNQYKNKGYAFSVMYELKKKFLK